MWVLCLFPLKLSVLARANTSPYLSLRAPACTWMPWQGCSCVYWGQMCFAGQPVIEGVWKGVCGWGSVWSNTGQGSERLSSSFEILGKRITIGPNGWVLPEALFPLSGFIFLFSWLSDAYGYSQMGLLCSCLAHLYLEYTWILMKETLLRFAKMKVLFLYFQP